MSERFTGRSGGNHSRLREVDALGAAVIGIVSGILVVFAVWFVENVLKVDDPVGAVAVHGFNGAWGTLAVGLFATDGGLFYGGGAHLLGVQSLGVVSIAAYAGCCYEYYLSDYG